MSSQSEALQGDGTPVKHANNGTTSAQTTEVVAGPQSPAPSRPNPYCYPERQLFTGRTYNGATLWNFPVSVDSLTHVKRIRDLSLRGDDVLIAAFPKCGTHWVSEMLHMLVSGSTEYATKAKEFNMLEFMEDMTTLDQQTSPRLLNSHLYTAHLPEQVLEKKVKLVHLIRNPKDCAVSLYHHSKQYSPPEFTFDNFIKGYTTEGYTSMSHQLNYLRQMAQFEEANPDHPIIHIHFEDLKKDPVPILEELAQFVGVQASWKFCQDVASACGFDRLKQDDVKKNKPEHLNKTFGRGFKIYRKGVVGDWKNMFTVAQSEMFDQFMAEQEKKGLHYDFRWH